MRPMKQLKTEVNKDSLNINSDFVSVIKSVLLERIKKNPNYSLRAFSKSIDVNHAHLSLILRGKRPLTIKFIKKVASILGYGPKEINQFIQQVSKPNITFSSIDYQLLDIDFFEYISEWYYDAILELSRFPDFNGDVKWISKKLNISYFKAKDALLRLQKLGLLSTDKNGKIIQGSPDTTTNASTETSSAALRQYQQTSLEMSIKALTELPRTYRDHSSMTVAMDIKDLPKAKTLIADFRAQFMSLVQKDPENFNQVFQINISLFPLTQVLDAEKSSKEIL